MKSWQTLSGPFEAPNGHTVETIGTEAGLEELGIHFRNGLMVPQGRRLWADLCKDGKRQIIAVRDGEGHLVANGELKVQGAEVRAMFVRGHANREMTAGAPGYDAVSSYVAAVNARAIPLDMLPHEGGFVVAERDKAPESPWERAMQFAHEREISPFAALVLGIGTNVEDAVEETPTPFEDVTWTPLSPAYHAPGGLVVEPVSTRSGLRTLGTELENNLFLPQVTAMTAEACRDGRAQILAVYSETDGIVAFGELTAARGQVVAMSCRGFADEDVPTHVASAVVAYVNAVNTRAIGTNLSADASGFVDGPANDINPFAGDARVNLSGGIPRALREGYSEPMDDRGEDFGEDFGEEFDQPDTRPGM